MSKELLEDRPIDGVLNVRRARLRRIWFVSGLVLWVAVGVAAIFLIRVKRAERPIPDAASIPASLATVDGSAGEGTTGSQTPASGRTLETASAEKKPAASKESPSPWSTAGIDDFVFTERSGRKVAKADLLGRPWLISFIFTRCAGPCPRVSGQMSELQTYLKGTDVRLVTLTVDPDFDTAEVLNRYAQSYKADPSRWLYLTGDKRKTYELISKSFQMPVMEMTGKDREPGYEVLHSTSILLVNEKGVVVQKYNARDDVDMARLRNDLRPYLRREAGANGAASTRPSGAASKANVALKATNH